VDLALFGLIDAALSQYGLDPGWQVRKGLKEIRSIIEWMKEIRSIIEKGPVPLWNPSLILEKRKTSHDLVLEKSSPRPMIFLCHAKEDDERVADLFHRLSDQGFEPWYDKEKLDVGDRWENEIISAIEKSDFFAVCLSRKAVKKEGFVQKEIRTAIRQYQLGSFDLAFLLPIRLEECEVPDIRIDENTTLRSVQWADLFHNDDRAFDRFVSGIWKQWKRKRSRKT
jgi:hypothetical protein